MDGLGRPGFHGKLPSRGDFLTRGLPRGFVEPWDEWLQKGIAASRESLGDDWLAIYLESPVWRFALSEGACGADPLAGLFLPSVDKVGRCFPFTVAERMPPATSPFLALGFGRWLDEIENRARAALDEAGLDPAALYEGLASCGMPSSEPATPIATAEAELVVVPIGDGGRPDQGLAALSDALFSARAGNRSLWWTSGSDLCPPLLVASSGLPAPASFEIFLTGRLPLGRSSGDPTPGRSRG
jgi:type VI secretion system protein ImpM